MRSRLQSVIASFLVAFGVSKALAQAFLLTWERLSEGQPDIAARGIWLLAAFLPEITIAGAGIAIGMAWAFLRRDGPVLGVLPRATVGGTLGGVAIFAGLDPTVFVLRHFPGPAWGYYFTSMGAGLAIAICGITILRSRRHTIIQAAVS